MSKKAGIVIITILIIVIVLGVAVGYFFIKNKESTSKEDKKYIYTTDEMFCNIKNSSRIAKVRISVASTNEEVIKDIRENDYLIRDTSNKIIRNKKEVELEGQEGQKVLKDAIKKEIEEVFPDGEITDIYFDDFVIQ